MITEHKSLWTQAKTPLIALSCVTALSVFALIARPVQADEATAEVELRTEIIAKPDSTESVNPIANVLSDAPSSTSTVASETAVNQPATSVTTALEETASVAARGTATENVNISGPSNSETSSVTDSNDKVPDEAIDVTDDQPSPETQPSSDVTTETPTSEETKPEINITGGHYYQDSNGYWYYADKDGNDLRGQHVVDGQHVYFGDFGRQAKNQSVVIDNDYYFYDQDGHMVTNQRLLAEDSYPKTFRHYGKDGKAIKGWENSEGQRHYYDNRALQVMGQSHEIDGETYFFEKNTGNMVSNQFVIENEVRREPFQLFGGSTFYKEFPYTITYYYDHMGRRLKGWQTLNGERYYFAKREHPGFEMVDGKTYYFTHSARMMHDEFVTVDNQSYYLGKDGVRLSGLQTIDDQTYYFNPDKNDQMATGLTVIGDKIYYFQDSNTKNAGQLLKDSTFKDGEIELSSDKQGLARVTNTYPDFVSDKDGHWYFINADGQFVTGSQVIDGVKYYFDSDGRQVKGQLRTVDGHLHFYDHDTGALITNRFVTHNEGRFISEKDYDEDNKFYSQVYNNYYYDSNPGLKRYYFGSDGNPVTGWQTIDGERYYFQADGNVIVNRFMSIDGNRYYFHHSGRIARNERINIPDHYYLRQFDNIYKFDNEGISTRISNKYKDIHEHFNEFIQEKNGKWRFYDDYGTPVFGENTIDSYEMYFHHNTGYQAKDEIINLKDKYSYFDKDNGRKVKNTSFVYKGQTYLADQDGRLKLKGDGSHRQQYFSDNQGNWYYADADGNILLGAQTIDGVQVYFDETGKQYKGHFAPDQYYRDIHTGAIVTNSMVEDNGREFLLDDTGKKFDGPLTIDDKHYYFIHGEKAKGGFAGYGDSYGYYDKETGARVTSNFVEADGHWYYIDADGHMVWGAQTINGKHYFFFGDRSSALNYQARNQFVTHRSGTISYYDNNGVRLENTVATINNVTYRFDTDGNTYVLR